METYSEQIVLVLSRSSSSGENQVTEHCSFCEADVRLESPEVAKCSGVASETGFSKHKLQRCSVSLQVRVSPEVSLICL